MLYAGNPDMLKALDIEFNKKNRVTATQFASEEAIANTSRSPLFNTIIYDEQQNSNRKNQNRKIK